MKGARVVRRDGVGLAASGWSGPRRRAILRSWLIDLEARRLEEYAQPSPEGSYALVRVCAGDDILTVPRTTRTTRLRDLLP